VIVSPYGFLFVVALFSVVSMAQASTLPDLNGGSGILADAAHGKKKRQGFFGAVSIGYLATTGNSQAANLSAKTSFGYVAAPWRHAFMLQAVKGSTNGVTTAEEYEAAEQTDYTFSENNYVYGALNYSTNRFAGYDQRTTEVIGYGRRLLASDTQMLDVQIGGGARQTRQTDDTRRNEPIVQLAGAYRWDFSDNANFSQQIKVEDGSDNTYSENVTALTANLSGGLALSISYTVKHNSTVPAGSEKTDTATAVSVIYGF
jgi:putative salt-induced outer membrane protein